MADQNFMDLASKTASGITGTDYMMLVNNSEAYKALVNDVAEAILGKLTSKSFSGLETTAKNVIGALNELNSKTNNINGYILISFVNATDTIKIQTKFDSIPTSGAMRQSIFMFGTANGTTVYGMITLFSNTPLNSRWNGVGNVGVNIDSNGIVTITLPQTSYDRFILISSEKIAGL